MSRIFQYEPLGPLFGSPENERSFDYGEPVKYDELASFVTFCLNPIYYGACRDALGNLALMSGFNSARVIPDSTPFQFGNKDFTLEFALKMSSGYNHPTLTYQNIGWQYIYMEGAIDAYINGDTSGGPLVFYMHGTDAQRIKVGSIPWLYTLRDTINGFNFISLTRKNTQFYTHYNGALISTVNVPIGWTIAPTTAPIYFMCLPDKASLFGDTMTIRATVGTARYRGNNLGPQCMKGSGGQRIATVLPSKLPCIKSRGFVSGQASSLNPCIQGRTYPTPLVQSAFNPKDLAPISWHDTTDVGLLKFSSLVPIPVTLQGKPGATRQLSHKLSENDVYSSSVGLPQKLERGVLSAQSGNLSTLQTSGFSFYIVVAQGLRNQNGSYSFATSSQQSLKRGFSFSYTGTSYQLVFFTYAEDTLDPSTDYYTAIDIPFPSTTKESPAVFFGKKVGSIWTIGINDISVSFEYGSSQLVPTLNFGLWVNAAQVFYEALSFGSGAAVLHEEIIDYLYKKHRVGAAISEINTEVAIAATGGAILEAATFKSSVISQENAFFIPEEQLPALINIDLSRDEFCIENSEGMLIGYVDAANRDRQFSMVGYGGFRPREHPSWGSHFKAFQPITENSWPEDGYKKFFSTRRYSAPSGMTMFFVGKMPNVLLTQGTDGSNTDRFFYGMDSFEDLPFYPTPTYGHLTAKIDGQLGIYYGGAYVYDLKYTARSDIANFSTWGLTSSLTTTYPALPCIICYKVGTSSIHEVIINGVPVSLSGTQTLPWPSGDSLSICDNMGAPNEIAQFLMIDGLLSTENIQKTIAQLAHKWNLASLLPVDYLYKNSPPLI